MKNFFKKLSFVLAIAMVLTSIAPATASAAEVVPAKKVNVKLNGEKVTSVELDVEETETVKIGLPVKKAYEGQKSTFKTWAVSDDESVVEVTRVGNRKYELTGVAAGETTITISAAKTKKLAKAGEGKQATITVTVNEVAAELAAAQTGVKKITVTGTDLTGAKADYTLKRGNVTVTVNSVELNEDKTEATLVASSAKFPAGEYTVTFNEVTTPVFEVEDGKIDSFEISPNLVLDDDFGVASSASITYKALNQFGEDITKTFSTVSVSCTLGVVAGNAPDYTNGRIVVTNISNYHQLGTTGRVTMIATDGSGVQNDAEVVLSTKRLPASVEVKGVYNKTLNTMVDLKANSWYDTWAELELIVDVKDQYDSVYTGGFNSDEITIITNPVLTNFSLDLGDSYAIAGNTYDWTLGGYHLPITEANYVAGTVTFTFILKNAVATTTNITSTLEIGETARVASIDVYPLDTVYYGEENKFGYLALDEDGNEVTSYDLLIDPTYGITCPAGFHFEEPSYDDVAVLYFNAESPACSPVAENIQGYYSGMFSTRNYDFTKMASFNYSAEAHPQYVLGINNAYLGKTVTGSAISVGKGNLIIGDQYGREMTSVAGFEEYSVKASYPVGATSAAISGASINIATGSSVIDIIPQVYDAAQTIVLTLYNDDEEVKNSDTTFTVKAAELSKLSRFEMKEIGTISRNASQDGLNTRGEADVVVYGYTVDGIKCVVPEDDYNVVSQLWNGSEITGASASAVKSTWGDTNTTFEQNYNVKVAIKNNAGTELNQTVTVKFATPTISSCAEKWGRSYVTVASTDAITGFGAAVAEKLYTVDQFGYEMGTQDWTVNEFQAGHIANVYIYDCETANTAIENNNTATAGFTAAGYSDCMVTITFTSGLQYTTKVVFE